MTAGFGGSPYTNPQTRALNSIANGGDPDTSSQEKLVELLQTHSVQLRYLAANQKQMQKGIDDANANSIQQIQQFIAEIVVLFSGGELVKGALDFGDLQYMLPALGALFGFDSDRPFPISLFEAAQKFFLGYVVPQEQFVDVINSIITGWAEMVGIDPKFIADVRKLLEAFGNLFEGLENLLPSLDQLFSSLGISGADLGPLGQALGPIIQLFSGMDLTKFGSMIEFITDAIDPVIVQLTAVINFVNGVLAVLGYDGGDVVNSPLPSLLQPFQNLTGFLGGVNFFGDDFDPMAAVAQFVNMMLLPQNLLLGPDSPISATNLFGSINQWQLPPISIGRLTGAPQDLVADGSFSLTPSGGDSPWFQLPTGGLGGSGALSILGTGAADEMIGRPFGVSEGQTLRPSAQVSWESASGSAGSVLLNLLEFSGQNQVGTVLIGSVTPTGTSSWVELAKDYTVPAGVDTVALAPAVTSGFTSGTAMFSNITGPSTGKIEIPWVNDLSEIFDNVLQIFGLGDLADLISEVLDPSTIWSNVIDVLIDPLGMLASLVGGVVPGFQIPGLDASKIVSGNLSPDISGLQTLINGVLGGSSGTTGQLATSLFNTTDLSQNTAIGMFNNWFNTGTGTPTAAAVNTTVTNMRTLVVDGYTLVTWGTSTTWVVPQCNELWTGVSGAGGRGEDGETYAYPSAAISKGGRGGSSGGYLMQKQNAATASGKTATITVGSYTAATSPGADGGYSQISGSGLATVRSVPNTGGIVTPHGYQQAASMPGRGGRGGDCQTLTRAYDGDAGDNVIGYSYGGNGGAGVSSTTSATGFNASPGSNGTTTGLPISGGSGGGGGGGAAVTTGFGGTAKGGGGGAGGYPGGGGGGGGAAAGSSVTAGAGAYGANGFCFAIYK